MGTRLQLDKRIKAGNCTLLGSAGHLSRGEHPPLLRASGLLEHPDRSQDEDQQYGTADGDDEADDGATFLKAQQPGNPEAEYRADDADDDVGNQPHLLIGLHDDAGQPADNTADDQSHYPTHGPTSRCDENVLTSKAADPPVCL